MPFVEGDVVVKQLTGSTWELRETVAYQGRTDLLKVPAGFVTDFASVPRALVWLLPRYGDYTRAAILHDHLVTSDKVSRADADGLFRRAMRELDVSLARRWMMWAAVRAASFLKGASPKEVVQFVLVAVPSVLYLAIPVVIVQVYLLLFWLVELIVWIAEKTFTRHEPPRPELQNMTA
ncbi:hypothetical protein BH24ACT15_BH24ACT15_24060 [soil metagenome]